MSKIRINDLARELEVKSKEILDVLTTVGITEKKTHSSSLEEHEAELVRKHLRGRSGAAPSSAKTSRAARGEGEIKTKINLSHISRPGDVLRAITQQKEDAQPRPSGRVIMPQTGPRPVYTVKATDNVVKLETSGSAKPEHKSAHQDAIEQAEEALKALRTQEAQSGARGTLKKY
jgi:translation initiation factor IF-2